MIRRKALLRFILTYVAQLDGCGKFFVVFCSTFVISRNYLEEQFGFLEKRGI